MNAVDEPAQPRDRNHSPVGHDGLGPVPAFTTAQHSAARAVLLSHVGDELRAGTTSTSGAPLPSSRAQRRPGRAVWSRRGLLTCLSAAGVAALAAGTLHYGGSGGDDLLPSTTGPVLPMSAVAYTLPSAAVTTDRSRCTTRIGTTADGDGLRYLLEGTSGLPLTNSMVRTDNCFTSGWPAASFISTTADGQHLTQAITVWGPGVDGLAAPGAGNAVRATTVEGHPARVLVAAWGVIESWNSPDGTWGITAASTDEATVQRLAESIVTAGGADDVQAQLPDLQEVDLPASPTLPVKRFAASYGSEAVGGAETNSWLEFDVGPARVPWAAWASTGPLEGTELVDVNGSTAWSVQDPSDPVGMLVWEVAPGVSALLRGRVDGSTDLAPYARTVQPVTADDPRISSSDVDH